MSDEESTDETQTCYYGTPLQPYDEDSFPSKKPIAVEEQVAKDAQGRRRFHGAFTGGFSAGFFNTVGSLEGWTPSEFRSSRTEKAGSSNVQVPEDFMDDEDLSEFGIAPQAVRAKNEYDSKKRKRQPAQSDGPIPGTPVLETLIEAGNETVGYFLMKNMNRRHHQQAHTDVKVYGCAMPSNTNDDNPTDDCSVPDCYKGYLANPKSNSSGLGYTSLDKTHLNLFKPARLTVRERNNKKLSIAGQAFGVGAFEDEDEDIYVKDDMTRYDFELTNEIASKPHTSKERLLFEMFVPSKLVLFKDRTTFPPPVLPSTFTGKHKVKKSRFEPVPVTQQQPLNAAVRARYLDEKPPDPTPPPPPASVPPAIVKTELMENILVDRFVGESKDAPVKTETDHGSEEMRAAAKMKMFGPLTRVTLPWQPCAFLCKRFNVPEPLFENTNTQVRKRTKNLIFEYQKHEEKPVLQVGLDVKPSTSSISAPVNNVEAAETPLPNDVALDITERLDVSKKTDLFKAVFLSSSESEASDNEIEETPVKELVLDEPLVLKIKPTKEGILSNLCFPKSIPVAAPVVEESNLYGPRLPSGLVSVAVTEIDQPVFNNDEWVEKGSVKERHKKRKKEKKKHRHKFKK